jgi:chromosome segregation ATPase
VAELEAKPAAKSEDHRVAELQAWVDSSEAEAEQLRARVAELEAKPAAKSEDHRVAELQAWVDSSEAEAEQLRARVAELEAKPAAKAEDHRVAELQAWVDSAESDAEELRARAARAEEELARVKSRFELLGGSVGEGTQLASENRTLVERLSALESANHSLRGLSTHFADQVESSAHRDVARLTAQLDEARAGGAQERVVELETALSSAQEAVATLQVQREAAVDQVRRYVEGDAESAEKNLRALETKHRAERVASERQVAGLEAQLAETIDQASVLQVRLKAHQSEEQKLEAEVTTLRERACAAEQALGALASELEVTRADKGTLEARSQDLSSRLEETQRWLAQGELDTADLAKQLEAIKTEHAVLAATSAHAEPIAALPRALAPPPPPADEGDELEGFSPQRMHRLEALLAAEKVKTGLLERFVATAESSLLSLQDELEAAGGRLADLRKRLGLADSETGETLDRLEAARRELHALFGELARTKEGVAPGAEAELLEPDDVMEAPLSDLEAQAHQQAAIAQEATQALAGEQRAREQLMGDLNWLKAELEQVSNVREDLRHRIQAMVQRELKRKQVVSALLDKLRSTEVAAAARAGTMRRLSAAMELAQRNAVRVQTVYFQKQIGSLQRQLETALNLRRPGVVKLVR